MGIAIPSLVFIRYSSDDASVSRSAVLQYTQRGNVFIEIFVGDFSREGNSIEMAERISPNSI